MTHKEKSEELVAKFGKELALKIVEELLLKEAITNSIGIHQPEEIHIHIIENDCWPNRAIKLDDGVVDIAGNNIVVIRDWDLKFLDDKPPRELKPVTEKQYLNAKRIVERYEKQLKEEIC